MSPWLYERVLEAARLKLAGLEVGVAELARIARRTSGITLEGGRPYLTLFVFAVMERGEVLVDLASEIRGAGQARDRFHKRLFPPKALKRFDLTVAAGFLRMKLSLPYNDRPMRVVDCANGNRPVYIAASELPHQ